VRMAGRVPTLGMGAMTGMQEPVATAAVSAG